MVGQRNKPNRLGIGLYSIPEAARLLRAHPQRVRRWIQPEEGLIPRVFDAEERTICFLELMELHAVRFWPQDITGRVVLDPRRRFGKPIDSPTGVPTISLFHAIEAGEDAATVASWFAVPVAAITAAVAFEKSFAA